MQAQLEAARHDARAAAQQLATANNRASGLERDLAKTGAALAAAESRAASAEARAADLGGKNAQLARAVADMRRGAEAARRKKMAEARHNGFDEQACTLSLALPLQQCHRREAGSVATDFRRDHRSIPCAQYSQHPACLPGCVRAMPEAA